MRVLLQRVSESSVTIDGNVVGHIKRGYLLFLGVLTGDTEVQADYLAEKIVKLRLFDSENGKINDRSLIDVDGEILVVSQFTLAGNTEKGNRPDYTAAAPRVEAERLYEYFIAKLRALEIQKIATGTFGAMMDVSLTNDGPVTLLLEKAPVL